MNETAMGASLKRDDTELRISCIDFALRTISMSYPSPGGSTDGHGSKALEIAKKFETYIRNGE